MAQYKFMQDYKAGTYVPSGAGAATTVVTFSKDQVVEGNLIRNEKQSEPPNFIVVKTPKGDVRIPFGGRGGSVLSSCIQPLNCIKAPCGEMNICSGAKVSATAKTIADSSNVPDPRIKRYLTIGVLIFILIGLVFAYKKYPKAVKMLGVVLLIALAVKGSINYKKYGNLIGWH